MRIDYLDMTIHDLRRYIMIDENDIINFQVQTKVEFSICRNKIIIRLFIQNLHELIVTNFLSKYDKM